MLRPFWLHQAAEYLLGLVLVAVGLQSIDPPAPMLAGGLVILNAAVVDGPLGAFRLMSRRQHRIADLVVIIGIGIAVVLPFLDIDNASRGMMVVTAVILGLVGWNSPRPTAALPSASWGRCRSIDPRRSDAAPGASPATSPGPCATARTGRRGAAMTFERPAPDLQKLIAAWEQFEAGEETPGRVLANLKTAGLADVLRELAESGWAPATAS